MHRERCIFAAAAVSSIKENNCESSINRRRRIIDRQSFIVGETSQRASPPHLIEGLEAEADFNFLLPHFSPPPFGFESRNNQYRHATRRRRRRWRNSLSSLISF